MADRSPQQEAGKSPEEENNQKVEPEAVPENTQDLPLEREKLLSQIEGEEDTEPKKKKRRRKRRRSKPDRKKEKSEELKGEERTLDEPERQESQEEPVEEQEQTEKPKKRRRRRRRSRKKKSQEQPPTEEKPVVVQQKAEASPTEVEQESELQSKPEEEPPKEAPVEEEKSEEPVKEEQPEPPLATGFDEPLEEKPPMEVEDHSEVEEVEEEVTEEIVQEEKAEVSEPVAEPVEGEKPPVEEEKLEESFTLEQQPEPEPEPVIEQVWEGPEEEELPEIEPEPPKPLEPEKEEPQPEPEAEIKAEEPEPEEVPEVVVPEDQPVEPIREPPEEDIAIQPQPEADVVLPPNRAETPEPVEEVQEIEEVVPPVEDDAATIPADSKIELAPEDEESNLPPISLEKTKEEEKMISQEYPQDQQEVTPEVVPSGEEELEVAPEGDSVETDTVEESESIEETPEEIQRKIDEKKAELGLEEATLMEKQSLFDSLRNVMAELSPTLGSVFNVRLIGGIIVLVGLVWGGFWVFSQNFFGLFDGQESPPIDQTRPFEESTADEYGVETGQMFGMNTGAAADDIPGSVRIADYFGTLSEPQIGGETGITAATYYGELLDEREIVNQFVEYVRKLEELQNLYSIDVYSMLDQTTDRDGALTQYLAQLEEAEVEGQRLLQTIQLNIDDLTTSFNSVSDDKDTFENDFFTALNNLEAAKSDALLKSFVDVSQKQVALRARVAALSQVGEFYQTALEKLRERIDAVSRNQQALVQGIRVVEVPGASELDLIIRP